MKRIRMGKIDLLRGIEKEMNAGIHSWIILIRDLEATGDKNLAETFKQRIAGYRGCVEILRKYHVGWPENH